MVDVFSHHRIGANLREKKIAAKTVKAPTQDSGPTWQQRLNKGLSRARQDVWGKLGSIFSGDALTEEELEDVEALLYQADISPALVGQLIDTLQSRASEFKDNPGLVSDVVYQELKTRLDKAQQNLKPLKFDQPRPETIMIVGVNGAGKTTTVGKLAWNFAKQGHSVLVGACDNFRAAAVEQLEVWSQRAGALIVKPKSATAAASGVAYEACEQAASKKVDLCLLDTAGRLHTSTNLMQELSKTKKVISKIIDDGPHHTWLVLDAISGQNALAQAREFNQSLALTGLVFTKCDGSAKAGSAISIASELNLPIYYIGVGEDAEDLNEFDSEAYLKALLGRA